MKKDQDLKIMHPVISGSIIGIIIGILLGSLFYLLYGNVILFGFLMATGNFLGMAIGGVYGRMKAAEKAEKF